jgi:O-antigen/teichoic acid export membrane protein
MGKLLQIIPILLIVGGAVMLAQRPAYAYTDPGTGLLAIQAVGSALVAAGWYLRRKIHALFSRKTPDTPVPEPKEGEGANLP